MGNKYSYGAFLLVLLPSFALYAGEEISIDKAEQQCLKNTSSTARINNCTATAETQWDTEMNKYYRLLMKELSEEEALKLKQAQRAWVTFRDKEFDFINSRRFEGSMHTNIAAADKRAIVKQRARELKTYYGVMHQAAGGDPN